MKIGRDCTIAGGASVLCSLIGNNVIIHNGARIGQDGFGYAPGPAGMIKIVQIGRVIIQDNVEIGAETTIDRGTMDDTVIGEGTKIDNQVQIGHNVRSVDIVRWSAKSVSLAAPRSATACRLAAQPGSMVISRSATVPRLLR